MVTCDVGNISFRWHNSLEVDGGLGGVAAKMETWTSSSVLHRVSLASEVESWSKCTGAASAGSTRTKKKRERDLILLQSRSHWRRRATAHRGWSSADGIVGVKTSDGGDGCST